MTNVIKKLIKNGNEYEIYAQAGANIPDASSSTKGIVKLGDDTVQSVAGNSVSSKANRTYKVQANGSGQLVVNVPWTDTTYSEVSKSDMDTGTSTTAGVVAAKSIADYVAGKVSSVYKYKGSKATYADLPSTGNVTGDVWNVEAAYSTYPAGTNYAWNGTEWDPLGGSVDLSNYVDKTTAQTISGKKTFSTEPALPSKTSAATNSGTKPATEAQVYSVAQNIPTVYNSTITYTQAGDTITTSTTNQSSASTVALRGDIFVTQSEYTNLPSSKTTDGNTYLIYEVSN